MYLLTAVIAPGPSRVAYRQNDVPENPVRGTDTLVTHAESQYSSPARRAGA